MIHTKKELNQFIKDREKLGIKPGLKRVKTLLRLAGNPELNIKAVHVAGTNGKGSVIQFMQTALIKNGYRVGVFTSPSFKGIGGHYIIDGITADEEELIPFLNQLLPAIRELDQSGDAPTSFEIITVIAFIYFHKMVDIALIETGMGGKYDTTNCFNPILSVITNIAYDHTQFLGDSLAEIASHKAGIIKPNVPVVTGKLSIQSEEVIREEAEEKKATLYQQNVNYFLKNQIYKSETLNIHPTSLHIGLEGLHQLDNAAVAFTSLQLMRQLHFTLNLDLILEAFAHTFLPGRFEQVHTNPNVILDSAHNPAGIESFIKTVEQTDKAQNRQLLFAGFKDKQLDQMMLLLKDYFDVLTVTTFAHERAASIPVLTSLFKQSQVNIAYNWQETIDTFMCDTSGTTNYFITGSLHFITMVRAYMLEKYC